MTDRRAALLRLLTEYRPDDRDEARYRVEMLDLAAASHDPFDRHHFEPGHVTASAFVLHPDGERLLLIHHAKIEAWLQPGGHVDPSDESLVAAARREVEEETGLADLRPATEGVFDLDVHVFPERADEPEHLHYDVRFTFVAASPDLDPNHEALDVRWVAAADLEALGADRSILRPAAKLLPDVPAPAADNLSP